MSICCLLAGLAAAGADAGEGEQHPSSTEPGRSRIADGSGNRSTHQAIAGEVRSADALLGQGRPDLAVPILRAAAEAAAAQGDPGLEAAALTGLGAAEGALPDPDLNGARRHLERAIELAGAAGLPAVESAAANNLGGLEVRAGHRDRARSSYARALSAATRADRPDLAFRAAANHAALLAEDDGATPELEALIGRAEALGEARGAGPGGALDWARLGWAAHVAAWSKGALDPDLAARAARAYARGIDQATATDELAARSWALAWMGALEADRDQLVPAIELTRRAVRDAESVGEPATQARWHAQLGALERRRGRRDAAILHFEQAWQLDPVAASRDAADAPGALAPPHDVHLDLVDLLLRRAAASAAPGDGTDDLRLAQSVLERFKAEEVRDYFRDDCVDAYREKIEDPVEASRDAALLYPVVLEDRLVLLVSHGDDIRQFEVDVTAERLDAEVARYRLLLKRLTTRQYLRPARQLHAWLLDPVLAHLDRLGIETLVVVPGGSLRTVPLAALHDGEAFAIERYAFATLPGLELTDPGPLDLEGAELFLGGLSESVQGFPALPNVASELGTAEERFGGRLLLDEAFRSEAIEKTLRGREFSFVHIATHAEFGETNEDTFLLTYDGRITLDDLADFVGAFRYRSRPLDMILLSACSTAAGSDRAALGLAGVAVKSGARSAIASLWNVNDAATAAFVEHLYTALADPGVSRANAVRRAQRALMSDTRFAHPGHWSAFLLISSWL